MASSRHHCSRTRSVASRDGCRFSQEEASVYQDSISSSRSFRGRRSPVEDHELMDQRLSDEEDVSPDPPLFVGLFNPSLLKTLLHKASGTANIERPPIPQKGTSTNPSTTGDAAEALKSEDKKMDLIFWRAHQTSAWAIKAGITTSFFARTSLLWLCQLQLSIPPVEEKTHQNLRRLVAAAELMSDSSLHATNFSARGIAYNTGAHRLLWLKHWRADMKANWHLAAAPSKGGRLFGKVLDPYLIENKDKCKILAHLTKRMERRAPSYSCSPSFRPDAGTDQGAFSRPYQPRSDRQGERNNNRDRFRQQVQARRLFRGAGGVPTADPSDGPGGSPIGAG
ncbi:uncharacterized protein LOC120316552 isoform X2 [Crotalus tigris]|uniref:uncharacterized protein LOC120316552 isoform X2 n=1 Tax=Crotalus tigris TaxID=88082 RepID=UPI00192FAF83|nr:uncharacterized protein LOC120316552 isoform X2 [Crotalus tigris]